MEAQFGYCNGQTCFDVPIGFGKARKAKTRMASRTAGGKTAVVVGAIDCRLLSVQCMLRGLCYRLESRVLQRRYVGKSGGGRRSGSTCTIMVEEPGMHSLPDAVKAICITTQPSK